jgi:hypothetical protein
MLHARASKRAITGEAPPLQPPRTENALFAQLEQAQDFSITGLPVIKRLAPADDAFDPATNPRLAIGSHLGYGRISLNVPIRRLSDAEFLRVTKSLLNDKDLWYEKATESALSLSTLLGYLPILTVACESYSLTSDGAVEFIPAGGPHGSYARYLRILTDRMNRVIMIPTNSTDGHVFSLRHSGVTNESLMAHIEAALTPYVEVLRKHIASSPARPYLFGGAIGVCLKDTSQSLGIARGDGILLDQASYTNFPEELPLDQPHEAWRAKALEEAPHPRLVLGDLRSTYSPTRKFETQQLGFPVLRFTSDGEELE